MKTDIENELSDLLKWSNIHIIGLPEDAKDKKGRWFS